MICFEIVPEMFVLKLHLKYACVETVPENVDDPLPHEVSDIQIVILSLQ